VAVSVVGEKVGKGDLSRFKRCFPKKRYSIIFREAHASFAVPLQILRAIAGKIVYFFRFQTFVRLRGSVDKNRTYFEARG